MAWAVFGMFMGVWVATLLAWPDFTIDAASASSGDFDRRINRRHLRVWRQCTDRNLVPCHAAHLASGDCQTN